jgi:hypothetical protein
MVDLLRLVGKARSVRPVLVVPRSSLEEGGADLAKVFQRFRCLLRPSQEAVFFSSLSLVVTHAQEGDGLQEKLRSCFAGIPDIPSEFASRVSKG